MTTLVLIFLILSVFCVYQLGAIIVNVREIRRLRDIRYRSLTQHSFGVARQELMVLAGENEISSESITFLFFYLMDTEIMRHPDKYKVIARNLQKSFLNNAHDSSASRTAEILHKESENWTPKIRKMVLQNVSAINSLMVFHSPFLRTVFTLAKIMLPVLKTRIKHELGIFNSTSKILAKGNPAMRTFIEAKDELQHLARVA